MIRPAALGMAVAMTAVSAGTYFGLDLLPPGALGPFGRAVPDASASTPPPAENKAETVAAAAPQPAPAEPAAPAEQPMTEQDLEEAPPEAPAPAPADSAPQPQAVAEAPAAPAPEPQPEPAAPAPEPEPEAAPPPKPRKAGSPPTEVAKAEEPAAPKQPKQAPPEADVIKPWWPDSSKMPANQLKLQYAGQVQGEQAIALLFSAPLDLATLKQHASVKTQSGGSVTGEWSLGKNPRLAVFRGVGSGRFTVILDPRVADTKGFMLGTKLQGPVYIQAQ